MVSFTLQMICLSTDGYCMVLVMEATISMKLLEKITMNFVRAAFEQMHCGNKIAVGREDGTLLISRRLLQSSGARAGGAAFPSDSRGTSTSGYC